MQGKNIVPLLAACLATTIVVWTAPEKPLAAGGGVCPALADADDDFLPDGVEWTMLTSAADADTDGDDQSDFIEVLKNTDPRHANLPVPDDYQMRVVMAGPSPLGGDPLVWMHTFILLPNCKATGITSFAMWAEVPWLPSLRIPLDAFLPNMVFRERLVGDGSWLQVSVPLVPPSLILSIGNCTFRAQATIAGHTVSSGMQLVPAQGDLLAMVPVGTDGQFVFQSLSPTVAVDGDSSQSNRVCMLDLKEVGSGPGGTQYEILDASCEDANELECASTCPDSIGWIITVPGGIGLLGGN